MHFETTHVVLTGPFLEGAGVSHAAPLYETSHAHTAVFARLSVMHVPRCEHSKGHAASSHATPSDPGRHWHAPSMQSPRPEHGNKEAAASAACSRNENGCHPRGGRGQSFWSHRGPYQPSLQTQWASVVRSSRRSR